ncbi:hypothetical protein FH972_022587 [Carpinus fangiana]|uniref:threonine--tRNA ligase n=1 Tax=Carpinus fangiana TaxID=176857 RepID=A0A5N6KUX7_9ROSI|nr:hypothetical protein FH972_022587 [Carpinus fangiana]
MAEALPERPKADKKKKGGDAAASLELSPQPDYFDHRIKIFEELKAKQDAEIAAKPRNDINITLPDGSVKVGKSWETSPAEIARGISKSLFERVVVARVNGELWDLERPFEGDATLELIEFEDPEGKKVFWHSSAHILGEACERKYGCDLCIGPPVDDGFYYEMALPGGAGVKEEDLKPLEQIAAKAVKEKQPFERLTLKKEELLEMFRSNKYKQHIIKDKIPDGTSTTVYRCGPLIDLCRGPHVPHTGRVKAFKIMKNSASYFLGDATNDSLQRIYGVSFPDKKQLDEHLKYLEEAQKRDHRKIGTQQELFFFHELSPGACFFLPHGAIIYNTLMAFMREEYWKRGYQEVHSPNMFNSELWKRSGHWQHYQDGVFRFDVEKDQWALKPMNCPGHCLVFAHRNRSYQELPMRIAEFGVLHRNEASGALTGLTRVRKFVQDDAHIFCTEDQSMYGNFGFTFKLKLSTRPDDYLGDVATWDKAEAALSQALDNFCQKGGTKWELNPGDGAFYGPKIDITISDALKRDYQCATIQLDFNLPRRFNLEYVTASTGNQGGDAAKPVLKVAEPVVDAAKSAVETVKAAVGGSKDSKDKDSGDKKITEKNIERELTPGCARPVMLHRAIYGSFERFIAILTEHFAGKWPFWLSPRQVLIVPVTASVHDYCLEVQKLLRSKGMHVDVDLSGNTMQKKIRQGQLSAYNFTFVLGVSEKENRSVNIRDRDDQGTQTKAEEIPLQAAVEKLEKLREERTMPKLAPIV